MPHQQNTGTLAKLTQQAFQNQFAEQNIRAGFSDTAQRNLIADRQVRLQESQVLLNAINKGRDRKDDAEQQQFDNQLATKKFGLLEKNAVSIQQQRQFIIQKQQQEQLEQQRRSNVLQNILQGGGTSGAALSGRNLQGVSDPTGTSQVSNATVPLTGAEASTAGLPMEVENGTVFPGVTMPEQGQTNIDNPNLPLPKSILASKIDPGFQRSTQPPIGTLKPVQAQAGTGVLAPKGQVTTPSLNRVTTPENSVDRDRNDDIIRATIDQKNKLQAELAQREQELSRAAGLNNFTKEQRSVVDDTLKPRRAAIKIMEERIEEDKEINKRSFEKAGQRFRLAPQALRDREAELRFALLAVEVDRVGKDKKTITTEPDFIDIDGRKLKRDDVIAELLRVQAQIAFVQSDLNLRTTTTPPPGNPFVNERGEDINTGLGSTASQVDSLLSN